jgi:hypothetical protein
MLVAIGSVMILKLVSELHISSLDTEVQALFVGSWGYIRGLLKLINVLQV